MNSGIYKYVFAGLCCLVELLLHRMGILEGSFLYLSLKLSGSRQAFTIPNYENT